MNMKKALLSVMFLALGVAMLYGADFWNKKKYADWSQKEVQQMLQSSPWAHSVAMRTDSSGGSGGRSSGGGGGRRGGGGGSLGDASGGQGSGAGGAQGPEMVPSINLLIRWESALPVKQAKAMSAADATPEVFAAATKMLAQQETQYILSVSGVPLRMLRGDPAKLQPVALLTVKGKDPIKAESVKAERDRAGINLYLIFPRTFMIAAEDREVDVALKVGAIDIKTRFKLKEMVYEGKLNL
jgi:hypothetical protein